MRKTICCLITNFCETTCPACSDTHPNLSQGLYPTHQRMIPICQTSSETNCAIKFRACSRKDKRSHRRTGERTTGRAGRRTLKELGADLNCRTNNGLSPVHIAARNNRVEALQTLKELGADPPVPKTSWHLIRLFCMFKGLLQPPKLKT